MQLRAETAAVIPVTAVRRGRVLVVRREWRGIGRGYFDLEHPGCCPPVCCPLAWPAVFATCRQGTLSYALRLTSPISLAPVCQHMCINRVFHSSVN